MLLPLLLLKYTLTLRLAFVLFILFCVSATLFERGVGPLKPNRFGFPTILFVSFLVRGSRGVPVKINQFTCWLKHQTEWKQERLVVNIIVSGILLHTDIFINHFLGLMWLQNRYFRQQRKIYFLKIITL